MAGYVDVNQNAKNQADLTGKLATDFNSASSGQHNSIITNIASGKSTASAETTSAATAQLSKVPWYVWVLILGALGFWLWKKFKKNHK